MTENIAFNCTVDLLQIHQFDWKPLGRPLIAGLASFNQDTDDHESDERHVLVAFDIADISLIGEGKQMYYLTADGIAVAASPIAYWCWRYVESFELLDDQS